MDLCVIKNIRSLTKISGQIKVTSIHGEFTFIIT